MNQHQKRQIKKKSSLLISLYLVNNFHYNRSSVLIRGGTKKVLDIQKRLTYINDKIKNACTNCGRDSKEIRLIAVSKKKPHTAVESLLRLDQLNFGENYAQEMCEKAKELNPDIMWSFIGHLQSNKIKKIVEIAFEIQTLSSLKHAKLIEKAARDLNKNPYPIFIEVNAAKEESKSGIFIDEALSFYKKIKENFPNLKVMGIMAIPPREMSLNWSKESEDLYISLRRLANRIGEKKLSLGMSHDFEHAIRLGTDIIRIGSLLMGERK